MSHHQQILQDPLLSEKYQIIQKLGQGCFGKIYKVNNRELKVHTAVKLEIIDKTANTKKSMLQNQAQLLKTLKGKSFVPQFYTLGQWSMGNFIEIQLLEKDLNSLVDKTFSTDEIATLFAKLLQSLSVLHNSSIIHQDIKPQNIMINSKGEYVFIDFGISKKLYDSLNTSQAKKIRGFIGTPRYASLTAHKGMQQSKRDDLESLMYNVAYLYFKKLPWLSLRISGSKRIEEIKLIKQKTANDIFQQMGRSFSMAFNYIKKLQHMQDPNYKYLISLFKRSHSMIIDPVKKHEFSASKNINQNVVVKRNESKKYSLNPNKNYGKYLQLPLVGKEGITDITFAAADNSVGDTNYSQIHNGLRSMNGSKGLSMKAYNEMDEVTDVEDYKSFEKSMNLGEEEDMQPRIPNITKFFSPILLKNPFSNYR